MHALDAVTTQQAAMIFDAANLIWGLVIWALYVVALWPVFRKAGYPGWGAIIPIYNIYVLVKIGGFHGALTILFFVPIANIVMSILVAFGIGKAFGKGGAFSFFLLWLFAIIGYFIVGYGSARYIGPGGDPSRARVGSEAAVAA